MKKLIFLACLVMASSAFARGYGTAGCGLGSMWFGHEKGMMQVLAATTNGSSGNQTFGISTGTSNCADGSGKTATLFIEANKAQLANDIARGHGETLDSLTAMYGCNNTTSVGRTLQKNYQQIFPSQSVGSERINATITDIIKTNSACKA